MKYLKFYESMENEEDDIIRRNFYYTKECEKIVCDAISHFGIKNFNGVEVSDGEEKGNMTIINEDNRNCISFSVQGQGLYKFIGKNNFEKFHFRSEDGFVKFSAWVKENLVYLRNPVTEVIRRRGYRREVTRHFTNKKYKILSFGGTSNSYFNIKDGEEMLKNIKSFAIKNIKDPGMLYDVSDVMKKINK